MPRYAMLCHCAVPLSTRGIPAILVYLHAAKLNPGSFQQPHVKGCSGSKSPQAERHVAPHSQTHKHVRDSQLLCS